MLMSYLDFLLGELFSRFSWLDGLITGQRSTAIILFSKVLTFQSQSFAKNINIIQVTIAIIKKSSSLNEKKGKKR